MSNNKTTRVIPFTHWLAAVVTHTVNAGANWQDVDLSGDGIPANSEVLMTVASAGSGGVRPNGSTLDVRGTTGGVGGVWTVWCPVDASSILEAYWDGAQPATYSFWAYKTNTKYQLL